MYLPCVRGIPLFDQFVSSQILPCDKLVEWFASFPRPVDECPSLCGYTHCCHLTGCKAGIYKQYIDIYLSKLNLFYKKSKRWKMVIVWRNGREPLPSNGTVRACNNNIIKRASWNVKGDLCSTDVCVWYMMKNDREL